MDVLTSGRISTQIRDQIIKSIASGDLKINPSVKIGYIPQEIKFKNENLIIAVCGCMMQQEKI